MCVTDTIQPEVFTTNSLVVVTGISKMNSILGKAVESQTKNAYAENVVPSQRKVVNANENEGVSVARVVLPDAPKKRGPILTFPLKLYYMLSNPELEDIISWLPHGCGWQLLDLEAFEEKVLPVYFSHGNYRSFRRQVNGWGFKRITYNQYHHEMFVRDSPWLCANMNRQPRGITEKKKQKNIQTTPPKFDAKNSSRVGKSTSHSILQQQGIIHQLKTQERVLLLRIQHESMGILMRSAKETIIPAQSDLIEKVKQKSLIVAPMMSDREGIIRAQAEMLTKKRQKPMDTKKGNLQTLKRIKLVEQENRKNIETSRLIREQGRKLTELKKKTNDLKIAERERLIREQGERLANLKRKKINGKKSGKSFTNNDLVAAIAMKDLFSQS